MKVNKKIPFIQGDGIGPDIWAAARNVFDAAVTKAYDGQRSVEWIEVLAGERAFKKTKSWLPEETLNAFRTHRIGIKGPLTTPVGGGIRSLNVALRQALDLYVCLRPIRYFKGVPSPVVRPELVDMVVFRENTEDVYAGFEVQEGSQSAKELLKFCHDHFGWSIREDSGIGLKPISRTGSRRLVKAAAEYAIANGRKSITLVHKGNIQKFTEGSFRKWGYELAEQEFGDMVFTWSQYDRIVEKEGKQKADEAQESALKAGKILIKDVIADAFLQQILTRPAEYSVIATMNLNGDYISDALAAIVGGIGIAPGANINYETGHAIFEATHGTAPKYAGLDKVNPGSVILSGVMMLEYMGWNEAAEMIVGGLQNAILNKKVTYDFARLMDGVDELKCSEFGTAIIENM